MSKEEVEKLWDDFSREAYPFADARKVICHDNQGQEARQQAFILGIEVFKSALRKEIEKKLDENKFLWDKGSLNFGSFNSRQQFLKEMNELLDSLTPPKQ